MDAQLWASRLAAAKRQHTMHHSQSQLDRQILDDFEGEDEICPDFSCPYCYEEYDITSLCSHLDDEHSFESKAAVCSICAVKIGRDMVNHITAQHGHLFNSQRRRRLQRIGVQHTVTLSSMSRELREVHLQVLLGGGAFRSNNNLLSTSTDSLLSGLVYNFPVLDTKDCSRPTLSSIDENAARIWTTTQKQNSCIESSLNSEEEEQKIQQAALRAKFVQQLVVSSLNCDE